jgi:PIN domain nuclease of toxin-antitoxin system
MNCLLDTHAFLWATFTPGKLSRTAHRILTDAENDIFVSVISFWEISLKFSLGKIAMDGVNPEELPEIARQSGFDLLALSAEEAASFHGLAREGHKDPFDRMLVHQAIRHRKTLVSADTALQIYAPHGLKLLW